METQPDKNIMIDVLYGLLHKNKEALSIFEHTLEIDFGYIHTDNTSYRGNAYMSMGKI